MQRQAFSECILCEDASREHIPSRDLAKHPHKSARGLCEMQRGTFSECILCKDAFRECILCERCIPRMHSQKSPYKFCQVTSQKAKRTHSVSKTPLRDAETCILRSHLAKHSLKSPRKTFLEVSLLHSTHCLKRKQSSTHPGAGPGNVQIKICKSQPLGEQEFVAKGKIFSEVSSLHNVLPNTATGLTFENLFVFVFLDTQSSQALEICISKSAAVSFWVNKYVFLYCVG